MPLLPTLACVIVSLGSTPLDSSVGLNPASQWSFRFQDDTSPHIVVDSQPVDPRTGLPGWLIMLDVDPNVFGPKAAHRLVESVVKSTTDETRVRYVYEYAIIGFSAWMSDSEVAAVRKHPLVKAVAPDINVRLTSHSEVRPTGPNVPTHAGPKLSLATIAAELNWVANATNVTPARVINMPIESEYNGEQIFIWDSVISALVDRGFELVLLGDKPFPAGSLAPVDVYTVNGNWPDRRSDTTVATSR